MASFTPLSNNLSSLSNMWTLLSSRTRTGKCILYVFHYTTSHSCLKLMEQQLGCYSTAGNQSRPLFFRQIWQSTHLRLCAGIYIHKMSSLKWRLENINQQQKSEHLVTSAATCIWTGVPTATLQITDHYMITATCLHESDKYKQDKEIFSLSIKTSNSSSKLTKNCCTL